MSEENLVEATIGDYVFSIGESTEIGKRIRVSRVAPSVTNFMLDLESNPNVDLEKVAYTYMLVVPLLADLSACVRSINGDTRHPLRVAMLNGNVQAWLDFASPVEKEFGMGPLHALWGVAVALNPSFSETSLAERARIAENDVRLAILQQAMQATDLSAEEPVPEPEESDVIEAADSLKEEIDAEAAKQNFLE